MEKCTCMLTSVTALARTGHQLCFLGTPKKLKVSMIIIPRNRNELQEIEVQEGEKKAIREIQKNLNSNSSTILSGE